MKPAQAAFVAGGAAVEAAAREVNAKRRAISNQLKGEPLKNLDPSSMHQRFRHPKLRLRADSVHLRPL